MKIRPFRRHAVFLQVFVCVLVFTVPAPGQDSSGAQSGAMPREYMGSWVGARLQCRKDESGPVKCGTPSAFAIHLRADGTGTCKGVDFPDKFIYRFPDNDTLIITSLDGSRKWELFDLKIENDFLSFHVYIYPDGTQAGGENYIHYVFDLARQEDKTDQDSSP